MASLTATNVLSSAAPVRNHGQVLGLPSISRRSVSSTQLISRPAVVPARVQRVVKAQIAQEAFQVADIGGFISGTAATVFAMTLIGLAVGFVLLRFEALVEEGKIV